MRSAHWIAACAVIALTGGTISVSETSASATASTHGLGVYVGELNPRQLGLLHAAGIERDETRLADRPGDKVAVEAVLGERQAARLVSQGLSLRRKKTAPAPAASQHVFRQYNVPGGLRAEMAATVADHPELAELVTVGTSLRGVPIQAVKVTRGAQQVPDGQRPAVLYLGGQHAREWITPEMTRRLMHHVIDGYGRDPALTTLLNTTELWFLPVANPDGYDYTFTPGNRLWRKNLRDNNGDGKITEVDGVDLNRNFADKWGYDNEGSSNDPSAETYRGSAPNSEPETRALDQLFRRIGFSFLINYHAPLELLLYGTGWQVATSTPDDQIATAMAGDHTRSAVPGADPRLIAALYTSNGDTNQHSQNRYGTIAFAVEMSACSTVANDPDSCADEFSFPDDEKLIDTEFRKNLPFALSAAASAKDPANPVSTVGRRTPDFTVDTFDTSYGSRQRVAVTARRSLRDVTLHYQINKNTPRTTGTNEWKGGDRYGDTSNRYFAELRGTVPGASPKDRVKVWFTADKNGATVTSPAFTYQVADHIGADVLVLAAEDVTGDSPTSTDGATSARYADEHVSALRQAGYTADVYDLDTHGRRAPHPLGVLSHYRTVVWETGDDILPQAAGQAEEGTIDAAALATDFAVRDYLNEGGKVLLDGKYAGYAQQNDWQYGSDSADCTVTCAPLSNDLLQYWLGAYSYVEAESAPALTGTSNAFAGFAGALNTAGSAGNQNHTTAFQTTTSSLPQASFPQFASAAAMTWQPPGGAPYAAQDGDWYVWSGEIAYDSYKRFTRTIDLSKATTGRLRFTTSFDLPNDQDFVFVEAHTPGSDDWTTLPEANGRTTTAIGQACSDGVTTTPFLSHYIGADCEPTGSTGSWNAASGSSAGRQEWNIDLSRYAGRQVEVSISYVDFSVVPGPGVFLDDARIEVDGVTSARTSFETDLGGWTAAAPPAGSPPAPGGTFHRTQQAFGAAVTTANSVYLGFGLEGLPPTTREDLVNRVMTYLNGPSRQRN
ncbi:M14 family zinc carboxypeptidase [Micromonospora sp. NPDC051925]|uniref:M14 family metallopeptidase n=1 Tax=Micromonospora sp. NPDC051925 TaxID=3364288 RepID=UPI0037C9A584